MTQQTVGAESALHTWLMVAFVSCSSVFFSILLYRNVGSPLADITTDVALGNAPDANRVKGTVPGSSISEASRREQLRAIIESFRNDPAVRAKATKAGYYNLESIDDYTTILVGSRSDESALSATVSYYHSKIVNTDNIKHNYQVTLIHSGTRWIIRALEFRLSFSDEELAKTGYTHAPVCDPGNPEWNFWVQFLDNPVFVDVDDDPTIASGSISEGTAVHGHTVGAADSGLQIALNRLDSELAVSTRTWRHRLDSDLATDIQFRRIIAEGADIVPEVVMRLKKSGPFGVRNASAVLIALAEHADADAIESLLVAARAQVSALTGDADMSTERRRVHFEAMQTALTALVRIVKIGTRHAEHVAASLSESLDTISDPQSRTLFLAALEDVSVSDASMHKREIDASDKSKPSPVIVSVPEVLERGISLVGSERT